MIRRLLPLGVSRQAINTPARSLQQAGLIHYSRGNVSVLDRPALERASCECYAVFNETYQRYMQIRIEKPPSDRQSE